MGAGLTFSLCTLGALPHLQAKSQFKRRSTANNVEIHIPVPNDADSPKFKTTVGSVKWVPENSEIVWSIKSFPVSTLSAGRPQTPTPTRLLPGSRAAWQPERCGPLRPGAGIPAWGCGEAQKGGWVENRAGWGGGAPASSCVCRVSTAPPPHPPAALLSLPATPVWSSACLQGCRLPALGPEQHRLQEHRAPAARPTSWRGHLAGVQGLEHWSLGLWAECPGTGRQERGCTDRTFLVGKRRSAFSLCLGAACVSCSGSCSSCPFAHFSVKCGHSLAGFQKLFACGRGEYFFFDSSCKWFSLVWCLSFSLASGVFSLCNLFDCGSFFFSSHGFLDTLSYVCGSCSYPFSSPILGHLMTPGISLLLLLSPCL